MNIQLARKIYRKSIHKHHGTKFDGVIDILISEARYKDNSILFYYDIYLVMKITDNNIIYINSNLLQTMYYNKIEGKKFSDFERSLLTLDEFIYEKRLAYVLSEIRSDKLSSIGI